jgi:SAM-dependent methyltransferase
VPIADARRWNQRYLTERRDSFEHPRPFLVDHASLLPTHGLALDAAMGLGGNASFLLKRGLRVIGVDISTVGVRQAKRRLPTLSAVVADLTAFDLPSNTFDVILNFYYLQRDLFSSYVRALKPGGILVFETLTVQMRETCPEIDPGYLLTPDELCRAFASEMEILVYHEGWAERGGRHPRAVASLVVRKP